MLAKGIDEGSIVSTSGSDHPTLRETAPSATRADDPGLVRWVGILGLLLISIGCLAFLLRSRGVGTFFGPVLASASTILGLAFLLFHAALDREQQVRRTYGLLGYLWLIAALIAALPINGPIGVNFLPYGFTCFVLGLLFLLPFVRNETEQNWRKPGVTTLGGVGAALALLGFLGGSISETFLAGSDKGVPHGVLLILLGLAFLWSFVGSLGTGSDLGHRAALAMGLVGAVVALTALGRSLLPQLLHQWGWTSRPSPYFVPSGLVLMGLGSLYAVVSACFCSESRLIVLFKRELSAFFYSPIAYLVLLSFSGVSAVLFLQFAGSLQGASLMQDSIPEPVITGYLLAWFPIICVLIAVPVLTMRLLSEEHRTGTLEVLLTAPLGEGAIVVSKFLAAFVFYMLIWAPWAVCLIALRVEGGQAFEYRPLLTFYLMLACTGASFLGMGLFCSSLTKNQIIAAVLTFMGMLLLTVTYFAKSAMEQRPVPGQTASGWVPILTHISYLDLWISSLFGEITLKFYIFHVSAAVFWLFLTVKVLEARRWR